MKERNKSLCEHFKLAHTSGRSLALLVQILDN